MGITTHVLDTSKGRPAAGVPVALERLDGNEWTFLARSTTDLDGRCRNLMEGPPDPALYRLTFGTAIYFGATPTFFPEVVIAFEVRDEAEHYHVPLLISPFGYSTYRGS